METQIWETSFMYFLSGKNMNNKVKKMTTETQLHIATLIFIQQLLISYVEAISNSDNKFVF